MNKINSVRDGSLLYGLLAEIAGDIMVQTSVAGFIQHTSRGLEDLGLNLPEMLITPHLCDLGRPQDRTAICSYLDEVISGFAATERLEFAAVAREDGLPERWYSLTLRPTPDENGLITGTMGVMRPIEPNHLVEQQLIEAAMTDSLTGLPNRRAFLTSAAQLLSRGPGGALALLEIDQFRAIALRFGQSAVDEVVMAFAQFLSVMQQSDHVVARIEGGRFAMLMPDAGQACALATVDEIVSTFARVTAGTSGSAGVVTANAGVAMIAGTLDCVLARAERALVLARAGGGTQTQLGDDPPRYLAGGMRG